MSESQSADTEPSVKAAWIREELWTRTYDWQVDDVIAGRVSHGAHLLWECLCRFARRLERASTPASRTLLKMLDISERELRQRFGELKAAGWVAIEVRQGAEFYGGFQRTTWLLSARAGPDSSAPGDRGGPPIEPLAVPPPGDRGGPPSYPEGDPDDPEGEKREGLPAQSRSSRSNQDGAPQKRKAPPWIVGLASELREIYPHGIKESGEVRKPTPKVTVERLRIALSRGDGKIKDDAEEIAGRMIQVAKQLAAIPRTPDQRRFVQSLEVWINQAGWENPPEVGPKPPKRLERGELTDAPTHHWNYERQAKERAEADKSHAEQHAREKRAERVKAGLPPEETPEEVEARSEMIHKKKAEFAAREAAREAAMKAAPATQPEVRGALSEAERERKKADNARRLAALTKGATS